MKDKDWERQLSEQIPRLRRYARALTQSASASDDLVQDCLERAWNKRGSWQQGSNLRAWLFSIMHNVFINNIRRNKLASDYVASISQDEQQYSSETNYLMRDLEVSLGRLKAEYREVVLLAGLEGLSYKEIATVTETPIGTVMSRLSRGREELRVLMSEHQSNSRALTQKQGAQAGGTSEKKSTKVVRIK